MADPTKTQADRNIGRFIAFRVFFNARFYYPVIAVMFVDYGLTLEQYALLNVVWAASIVCLEVPTGAIADRIGRRRMVVIAAGLMVVEMAILCLAPAGRSAWLFAVFAVNRIVSGAAEACASGADEALAYDSLACEGRAGEWPGVLSRLARWQSVGFVFAMVIGGLVYDPKAVQSVVRAFGSGWTVEQSATLRLPAVLTLGMAVLAWITAVGLREPAEHKAAVNHSTWQTMRDAGRWIIHTPAALVLIAAGLCFDSIIRLFLTFASSYYRLIDLPASAYGIIGAAIAGCGFLLAPVAKSLVAGYSAPRNFAMLAALLLAGLAGLACAWRIYGVIFAIIVSAGMFFLNFFLSHYLNALVDSGRRATVLSFKSLAMNLGYGAIGLMFGGLMRVLGRGAAGDAAVFAQALRWLPGYFALTCVGLAALAVAKRRRS